jgi:hypothetical protein
VTVDAQLRVGLVTLPGPQLGADTADPATRGIKIGVFGERMTGRTNSAASTGATITGLHSPLVLRSAAEHPVSATIANVRGLKLQAIIEALLDDRTLRTDLFSPFGLRAFGWEEQL